MIILKSTGVLFIPLHAEVHGYNEWHGAQDKSQKVLLHILSLTTFLWTPGIDCVVTKHMNVYVYTIYVIWRRIPRIHIILGFLIVSFFEKIVNPVRIYTAVFVRFN